MMEDNIIKSTKDFVVRRLPLMTTAKVLDFWILPLVPVFTQPSLTSIPYPLGMDVFNGRTVWVDTSAEARGMKILKRFQRAARMPVLIVQFGNVKHYHNPSHISVRASR